MKISVNKRLFIKALEIGGAFAGRTKGILPILDCVKIKVSDNLLTIVSSDNENAVSKKMEYINAEGNGSFCVPYKDLFSYVKLIPSDEIVLTEEGGSLKIEHNKGKMSLPTQSAEDFPSIETEESSMEIEMDAATLNNWIVDGQQFVSEDTLRPIMGTIYFYHRDDELGVCATDARTMFWDKISCDMPDFEFNLNKNAFRAVCTAVKDVDSVSIKIGERSVRFKADGCSVLARKVEQRFPNFKSVIPKDNHIEVKINREELIDAINRCKLSANTASLMKLSIEGMNMDITCADTDYNKASKESMFVDATSNITIGLNSNLFTKVLGAIHTDNVIIRFKDGQRPATIHEDSEESEKLFLLMPMML